MGRLVVGQPVVRPGALSGDNAGCDQGHGRVTEVTEQCCEIVRRDDVGINKRHKLGADCSKSGVAGSCGAAVGVPPKILRPSFLGQLSQVVAGRGRVIDHNDRERGGEDLEGGVELGGGLVGRDDHGEGAHIRARAGPRDRVGKTAVGKKAGYPRRGVIGDHNLAPVEALSGDSR